MKKSIIYLLVAWVMLSIIVANSSASPTGASSQSNDSIILVQGNVQGNGTPKQKRRSKIGFPEIVYFNNIQRGDSTFLVWEVKYADQITVSEVDPQGGSRALNVHKARSKGSLKITPKRTTTYQLKAKSSKSGRSVIYQLPIRKKRQVPDVSDVPKIVSFKISPTTVKAGGEITFHWEVKSAERVMLYEDGRKLDLRGAETWLSNRGNYSSTIDSKSTYVLVAKNRKGKTTRSRKITVKVASTTKGTCTITGRLYGKLRVEWTNNPDGKTGINVERTTHVGMFTHDGTLLKKAKVDKMGRYKFTFSIPAAGTRRIFHPLGYITSEPGQRSVYCKPGKIPNINFKMIGVRYD
ncbi:MAG: hypothetical protein GY775_09015 [Candidatus Scalindua sp.]|nr:hypothetical protein [Candidatus Scalindua sp.]